MLSGKSAIPVLVNRTEIKTRLTVSDRDRWILVAGGLLNYAKSGCMIRAASDRCRRADRGDCCGLAVTASNNFASDLASSPFIGYPFSVLRTIQEICDRLRERYDPESIILFGSQAQGKTTESSDIDILVVKETTDRPIDRRIQVEKALADREVPLDILVYTPHEMRYFYSLGSPFIEEVIETGRVLYMRKATE